MKKQIIALTTITALTFGITTACFAIGKKPATQNNQNELRSRISKNENTIAHVRALTNKVTKPSKDYFSSKPTFAQKTTTGDKKTTLEGYQNRMNTHDKKVIDAMMENVKATINTKRKKPESYSKEESDKDEAIVEQIRNIYTAKQNTK